MTGARSVPTIAVCVATYRRPDGLRALLRALDLQRFPDDPAPRVVVCVADNDPDASGEPIVVAARSEVGLDVRYRVEPARGVVPARNASVALGFEAGAEFVAFIDDDEIPEPDWLAALLRTQRSTGAPIVAGPVAEVLDDETPEWYRASGINVPARRGDGAPAPFAACGNSLYRASLLREVDGPFDHRFNTSGGEDVFLSLQLLERGATIVWSPDAVATTVVPSERLDWEHVLRRSYIGAASYARAERLVGGIRPVRLVTGTARVAIGLATTVGGLLVRAPGRRGTGLAGVAQGLGIISGAFGRGARAAWWR